MVAPLKFGNGYVISSDTLLGLWYLSMVGLKLIHASKRGPKATHAVDKLRYYCYWDLHGNGVPPFCPYSFKTESRHDANFVVTCGTVGCHNKQPPVPPVTVNLCIMTILGCLNLFRSWRHPLSVTLPFCPYAIMDNTDMVTDYTHRRKVSGVYWIPFAVCLSVSLPLLTFAQA